MYTLDELCRIALALDTICRSNGAEDGVLEALLRAMERDDAENNLEYIARVYAGTSIDEILEELQ